MKSNVIYIEPREERISDLFIPDKDDDMVSAFKTLIGCDDVTSSIFPFEEKSFIIINRKIDAGDSVGYFHLKDCIQCNGNVIVFRDTVDLWGDSVDTEDIKKLKESIVWGKMDEK